MILNEYFGFVLLYMCIIMWFLVKNSKSNGIFIVVNSFVFDFFI